MTFRHFHEKCSKCITLAENERFRSVPNSNHDFYGVPEHVDRRPWPSIDENMSIAENMNLGWRVCGLLVEESVCLWPLSDRGHENWVPFAS